jgi:hypothetical protein
MMQHGSEERRVARSTRPSCNLIPSPWHIQNYNCQGVGYISSCSAVFAKWSVLISNLLLSYVTCLVIFFY